METVEVLDSSKCLRRRWSKEDKKQRTELRAERLSSRSCSIYKTVISLNSFVGTTNDFLAVLETLDKNSGFKINDFFKAAEFSSQDSSFSLPLTISSINYSGSNLNSSLENAAKSGSFEYTVCNVQSGVAIPNQGLTNILDTKDTTQSLLKLRQKHNMSNNNRESCAVEKKNSSRSSILITSDLKIFMKTSSRTSTSTNKSLNQKINSALLNLVTLNQKNQHPHAKNEENRISIRSITHNIIDYYPKNSVYIEYFDPVQSNMDQYIDLTSRSLVKNFDSIKFESKTTTSKHIEVEAMNTCRTVSIYSTDASRPTSIKIQSCCFQALLCSQKKKSFGLKNSKKSKKSISLVKSVKDSNKKFVDSIFWKRKRKVIYKHFQTDIKQTIMLIVLSRIYVVTAN